MPSAKLTDLVSLAGAQVPTDLAYVVDVSVGVLGSKSTTLDDLFAIITKNITDGAVRFQGVAAPAASAVGAGAIYFDSTSNTFKVSENSGSYFDLGNVRGPSPPVTDNAIVRFDGVLAKTIQQSSITIDDTGALGLPDNIRQTFNPGANAAGINVGALAGDPGTPINGDLWYDSGNNLLRARINGASVNLGVSTPPGGLNTQVQFNNAAAFGGVSGFTSDGTNVTAGDGNLRATSPLITTSIDDANGNIIIGLSPVAVAVNQITVANAAAGGHPVISATGTNADINLTFSPKGAGVNQFTKNLLMDVGAGALDNLIYVDSLVTGAVNASFGFFVAGVGSADSGDGPYFLGRGNTFTAVANQRGSIFFAAGVAAAPGSTEGSINFFTNDPEDLRVRIARAGSTLPAVAITQSNTGEIGFTVNNPNASTVAIATFSVNAIPFVVIDSSANSYFGNGITNAAPANYILNATGGLGTDITGANLDLAGGKGTGNATPGMVAVRYPLIGATGTTLQSLSANRYPVVTNMFTSITSQTVVNTVAETTLFGTASAGSTRTIEAGLTRVGQIYRITINLNFSTTGTPTGRLQIKVGSTTIADTGAVAFPTANLNARGQITCDLGISAIGAVGNAFTSFLSLRYGDSTSFDGDKALRMLTAGGSQNIDFTASQAIDVTWIWGAASVSNTITAVSASIEIIR
jgi:hypothetical protein